MLTAAIVILCVLGVFALFWYLLVNTPSSWPIKQPLRSLPFLNIAASTAPKQDDPDAPLQRRVWYAAHRGGAWSGPANTMHTYRLAVEQYHTQILEIDVHLSADGELVLMHDLVVDNTTNGTGYIAKLPYSYLRTLDAGHWWQPQPGAAESSNSQYPLRGQGLTVPRLVDVLDEFADKYPNLIFFLDFKAADAVQPALALLQSRGLTHRLITGAVSPKVNDILLKHKPANVPAAVSVTAMLAMLILYWFGALRFRPSPHHHIVGFFVNHRTSKILSKRLFKALHDCDCLVALFGPGVNTAEAQRHWISIGCDIIVTDRPDIVPN